MTRAEEIAMVETLLESTARTVRLSDDGDTIWVQDIVHAARLRGFVRPDGADVATFVGRSGAAYTPHQVAMCIVDDGRVRARLGFGPKQGLPPVQAPANVLTYADLVETMRRMTELGNLTNEMALCVTVRAHLQELQDLRREAAQQMADVQRRGIALDEEDRLRTIAAQFGDRLAKIGAAQDDPAAEKTVEEMAGIAADAAEKWLRHRRYDAQPIDRDSSQFALLVGVAQLLSVTRR